MMGGQMKTVMGLVMVLAVIAGVAVGCFAVSGSWAAEPVENGEDTSVDWRPEASLVGGLQRFSSYQELRDFLETQPLQLGYWYNNVDRGGVLFGTDANLSIVEANGGYSGTNVQVQGVDEADIVKTDGEYIYLATDNRVIIARAYPPQKARVLCELEFEGHIQGLFVYGDRLVVLEGGGSSVYRSGISDSLEYYYAYMNKTAISIYDISNRERPVVGREVSVDGYCVSARMIDDYVYLVVSGSAWIANDNVTLPRVYEDDSVVEIQPADIWHSETPDYGYGFTTIMSVNMVNDDEEPVRETLLLGGASTVYVSPSNIYVTFTNWSNQGEKTGIHRIHIDEGQIEYHATGEVPGRLLNQFAMDEYGGCLRVATTSWNWNTSAFRGAQSNGVYTLDQSLEVCGRLENLAPGESIYSARFMGGRCYLVTFKKVDPLFVVDLTDPSMPRVLGELKITGYSDYLHPYDENHIIGIGKEAEAAEEGDFAWYQGVKISLFDVSDVAHPKEIAKYQIGDRGTDSPVLHDHKAFLFDRSRNLLVLPVSVAEIDEGDYPVDVPSWAYGEIVWQGAYVFDISLEGGLELRGEITHCDGGDLKHDMYALYDGYSSCSIERSLYIGDVLYTISDQKIGLNDLETLTDLGEINLK